MPGARANQSRSAAQGGRKEGDSARGGVKSHSPVAVDVIVERELLVLLDRAIRKYAHSDVLSDGPFCDEAIRVTGMVREPADTTAFRRVDELVVLTVE